MNLNRILFRRLMDAADDNGSAGTGGAAADRGDDFVPDAVIPASEAAAEEETTEEVGEKLKTSAEETPRELDGKFAKKDKEDTGPLIPKSRFDEQLGKERTRAEAAERRAAELEKAAAQVTRNLDIDKAVADVALLRKDERKALLDGDEDKAAQISAQADRLNRQIAIAESGEMTGQAKDQALEDMRFEMTLERLEDKYPMLTVGHEAYDQDLVDDILDKQSGLMQRERLSPSKALAKATESVMSRQAPAPAAEKIDPADEKIDPADEKIDPADEKAGLRKSAAVAKNLDAAARQPGSLKEAGMDSDKAGQTKATPAAGDMTLEEYDALPESTRAKMRGDFA